MKAGCMGGNCNTVSLNIFVIPISFSSVQYNGQMCPWGSLCYCSLENGRTSKLQLYLQDDYEMSHAECNRYSIIYSILPFLEAVIEVCWC